MEPAPPAAPPPPPAPSSEPKLKPGTQPLTPEQRARIERTTKAGLIPEDRSASAGEILGDLGASTVAGFNDEAWMGAPAKAMDIAGLDSPENRQKQMERNELGATLGRTAGYATDALAGPAKWLSDIAEVGGRKVAEKVTSKLGEKVINKALLPAAETAVSAAGYGAGKAVTEGKPLKDVVEDAQDYGTGGLLLHGAVKAGGAAAEGAGELGEKRQASKDVAKAKVADQEALAGLADKASPRARDRLASDPTEANRIATEYDLRSTVKDPVANKKAHEKALGQVNEVRNQALDAVDGTGATVKAIDLHLDLAKAQEGMRGSLAGNEAADAVSTYIKKIWHEYKADKGGAMTARQLSQEIADLRKGGFSDSGLPQSTAAAVKRKVADVLEATLDKHLDGVAKSQPLLADQIAGLKKANGDLAILSDLDKAAGKRAVSATLAKPVTEPTPGPPPAGGRFKRYVARPLATTVKAIERKGTKAVADFALMVRSANAGAGIPGKGPRMTVPEMMDLAKRMGIQGDMARGIVDKYLAPKDEEEQRTGGDDWPSERAKILEQSQS